jgi:hypothetical protein
MATQKQIAANRRNAKKSTGPRTSRGKAFTRLNALHHGLFAAVGIPSGASLKELNRIRNRFMASCPHSTAEQVGLIEQMVTAQWLWQYWLKTETQILNELSAAGPGRQIAMMNSFSIRQDRYARAFMKAHRAYERSRVAAPEF